VYVFVQVRLADKSENPMVRHECAEAIGSIASQPCEYILQQFADDPDQVVRESCEVALDIVDYEQSGLFQYATVEGAIRKH
jgi:deoxyhypusine monooxygenase